MRREHNDLIGDLELKLRTSEREAGVREDALRHEVAEIRKRWQDAVRRADGMRKDLSQSKTTKYFVSLSATGVCVYFFFVSQFFFLLFSSSAQH